jgi:hypothetical protein
MIGTTLVVAEIHQYMTIERISIISRQISIHVLRFGTWVGNACGLVASHDFVGLVGSSLFSYVHGSRAKIPQLLYECHGRFQFVVQF